MQIKTLEIGVGIFVVAGMLALFVLAFQVSGWKENGHGQSYTLQARFDNVSGLKNRAKVSVAAPPSNPFHPCCVTPCLALLPYVPLIYNQQTALVYCH